MSIDYFPELPRLKVGQIVRTTPKSRYFWEVVKVSDNKAILNPLTKTIEVADDDGVYHTRLLKPSIVSPQSEVEIIDPARLHELMTEAGAFQFKPKDRDLTPTKKPDKVGSYYDDKTSASTGKKTSRMPQDPVATFRFTETKKVSKGPGKTGSVRVKKIDRSDPKRVRRVAGGTLVNSTKRRKIRRSRASARGGSQPGVTPSTNGNVVRERHKTRGVNSMPVKKRAAKKNGRGRPAVPAGESREEKFVRVAQARVTKAIFAIGSMRTLGGASYASDGEQLEQIEAAIQQALEDVMEVLRSPEKAPPPSGFSFD